VVGKGEGGDEGRKKGWVKNGASPSEVKYWSGDGSAEDDVSASRPLGEGQGVGVGVGAR